MSVFFLADTHFGDGNILRYENRPFATVEEMDRELIRRWNEKVGAGDTVFHLGDFSARGEEEDRAILSQLAGEKVLVLGNHDRHRTPAQWRSLGFAEAVPWPLVWEGFFLLSHEPLYVNRNMPYANVFGHVHGNPAYRDARSRIREQTLSASRSSMSLTSSSFSRSLGVVAELPTDLILGI